jgi:PIN domain nuclease of toxin-antitoxin system
MKVLLDTHVWLWWLSEPERLPVTIREALEDGENPLYLSVVTSLEIAIKYAVGKLY